MVSTAETSNRRKVTLCIAKEICSSIFKLPKSQSQTKEIWAELFEPSDFFYRFGTFVTVDVHAGNGNRFAHIFVYHGVVLKL